MMYKVIKYFEDLQDNQHPYNVGDEYPRKGVTVDKDRIAELASASNKRGEVLIVEVKKPKKSNKA